MFLEKNHTIWGLFGLVFRPCFHEHLLIFELKKIHIDRVKILQKRRRRRNIAVWAKAFLLSPCKIYSMYFFFFTQHACLIVHTLGEVKEIVAQKPNKVREKGKEMKERMERQNTFKFRWRYSWYHKNKSQWDKLVDILKDILWRLEWVIHITLKWHMTHSLFGLCQIAFYLFRPSQNNYNSIHLD